MGCLPGNGIRRRRALGAAGKQRADAVYGNHATGSAVAAVDQWTFGLGEAGTTLVEAMTATMVFLIIMLGGIQYFLLPQTTLVKEKIRRLAVSAARTRLETLHAMGYDQISPNLNESNTAVLLGATAASRSTTVTFVDDAADGIAGGDQDGNIVDYKVIHVSVSWASGGQHTVSFSTAISN